MKGINRKNRQTLVYRNLASAIRPVSHSDDLPVPIFSVLPQITLPSTEEHSSPGDDTRDQDFSVEALPQLFSQVELNDLVRDLNFPKNSAELLASRLKEKNPLEKGVHITLIGVGIKSSFLSSPKGKSCFIAEMSVGFLINLVLRNTNQRNGVFS